MPLARLAAVLLVALAASCSVDVDFGGRGFACADAPICPPGTECRGSRCVPVGTPLDGGPDAFAIDAAVAPTLRGFMPPTVITEISSDTASDDDESFTADRLFVILNSSRGGAADLWTSARAVISDPWPDPVRDEELSSANSDTTGIVSPNGLFVLFSSNRAGTGLQDLYLASRMNRSQPWGLPMLLASISGPANDLASWISDDGTELIVHTDATGDYELYTTRGDPTTGVYEPLQPISELNVAGATDASARFAVGGLLITFHSDRPGGQGGDDLYVASRASLDQPFSNIRPIEGVNTAANESDAWLSEDLCYLALTKPDVDDISKIFETSCID